MIFGGPEWDAFWESQLLEAVKQGCCGNDAREVDSAGPLLLESYRCKVSVLAVYRNRPSTGKDLLVGLHTKDERGSCVCLRGAWDSGWPSAPGEAPHFSSGVGTRSRVSLWCFRAKYNRRGLVGVRGIVCRIFGW